MQFDSKGQIHTQAYPYLYYKQIIRNYLPFEKDIAVVDLACGHGTLILCLKNMGYQHIKGVDLSAEQIELAHSLGIHEVERHDMYDFLAEKTAAFDVVFLMDILEHLRKEDLLSFLDQVHSSLREKGCVIIHVPNATGIFGMRMRYGDLTHETCFTGQSIAQALTACRFRNIESFEERPIIHGVKSCIRYVLWCFLTSWWRLLLTIETGETKHLLSQNMLVVAKKFTGSLEEKG